MRLPLVAGIKRLVSFPSKVESVMVGDGPLLRCPGDTAGDGLLSRPSRRAIGLRKRKLSFDLSESGARETKEFKATFY